MTFPSFSKRSSSEEEALDQALNAWASGERHSELVEDPGISIGSPGPVREAPRRESDLATDALVFHRRADDTRRSDPAATGPAADTWNRVLRSTAQVQSRGGDMSSAAMSSKPHAAIIRPVPKINSQSLSRYLNHVASLLIVFGVAFAGAFMAMQINQPGGSNGQFALFSQTVDSATCDAEPLSVDRVMDIVKNPYPYMSNGPLGEPTQPENSDSTRVTGLQEAEWWDQGVIARGERSTPSDDQFESSSAFVNSYLDCVLTGSVGQIWTFYSPIHIQWLVLAELPVFASEEEVRANVEARIAGAADAEHAQYQWVKESLDRMGYAQVTVNPDQDLALAQSLWGTYFESTVTFGIQVVDEDGKTTFLSSATGNIMVRGQDHDMWGMTVSVGLDRFSERWYVLPYDPIRP